MRNGVLIFGLIGLPAICIQMIAQQAPEGIPAERGVYYRADSNWVPLPRTVLVPMNQGEMSQILGFGTHANSQLSGAHALVRSATPRPTFYVRGFSPFDGMYLVKSKVKNEYRVLPMKVHRDVFEGPDFRRGDAVDLEIRPITTNLASLQPRSDLKPGEYVLVMPPEAEYRWLDFGFAFGVPGNR